MRFRVPIIVLDYRAWNVYRGAAFVPECLFRNYFSTFYARIRLGRGLPDDGCSVLIDKKSKQRKHNGLSMCTAGFSRQTAGLNRLPARTVGTMGGSRSRESEM